MNYRITFSDVAEKDIGKMSAEIYSTCLDKKTTEEYVKGILEKIKGIADFPQSGTPLLFLKQSTGYRYVIYKSYLAFYRIEREVIVVERILFAKSNYFKDLIIELD